MSSRLAASVFGLSLAVGLATPGHAQQSCSTHRAWCEAVCTPAFVGYYYGGLPARCLASCDPRWQACLRTGIWVDLERVSSGGPESAGRY